MATARRAGGYVDVELLERAITANDTARGLVSGMAETAAAADRRLVGPLVRLACVLAGQLKDLTEMRHIRLRERQP